LHRVQNQSPDERRRRVWLHADPSRIALRGGVSLRLRARLQASAHYLALCSGALPGIPGFDDGWQRVVEHFERVDALTLTCAGP
jgi:hypothetical protein